MKRAAWAAGCVVAAILVYLCFRGIDFASARSSLGTIHPVWVLLALAANAFVLVLWAGMWRVFLPHSEEVAFGRLLECASYSALAINASPLAGGQISSAVLLSRRAGVSAASAISTTAIEVLAEGVAKVAIVALAISLAPVPSWMRDAAMGIAAVVGALAVVLLVVARQRVGGGLEALRDPRRFVTGLAIIAGMKGAEAAAILFVQQAFGLDLPLYTLPLVLSAIMLATMVPIVPGNFGVYEAAAFVVYRQLGVPAEIAAAVAVVQHVALLSAFAAASAVALLVARPRAVKEQAAGVVGAFLVWITLLSFATCIGVLALLRSMGSGRQWRGMARGQDEAPQGAPVLRRSG